MFNDVPKPFEGNLSVFYPVHKANDKMLETDWL